LLICVNFDKMACQE